MIPVIETLNRLASAWSGPACVMVLQSTLLVAAFAVVALGMRRSSPGLRYWLWQIAAIKLLVIPLWSVSIAIPALPGRDSRTRSDAGPTTRSGGDLGAEPADRHRLFDQGATTDRLPHSAQARGSWIVQIDWQAWLLMAWVLAVAGQVAAIAHQRKLLENLLRRTAPCDDPDLLALVAELSGRIGLRRPPEVAITDGGRSPFVCGLRHPVLVLPRGLARLLDLEPLRSVLLHELAHIHRRDLQWDWIPASARLLYFFPPAAHYIVYRARLERELACDQAAMILSDQCASGYASTLVEVVSRKSAPPALRAALASARLDGGEPCHALGAAIEITRSRPPS
jgi:beta-lactamase regulating signal transducer with metallopeptidase domain